MVKLQLFSKETEELVKSVPKRAVRRSSKKATITLSNGINYNGEKYISVGFEGHNEGSGSPCKTEAEALERVKEIQEQYKEKYQITIIDEEKIRYNSLLNKWKDYLIILCEEKHQEIDKIWFNTSVPYDCEIGIRMKGHRCWGYCVTFRFEKGLLKAYDSNFGGGTSCIETKTDEDIGLGIKKIMERVFNKECSNSGWEDGEDRGHREIKINEKGWISDSKW